MRRADLCALFALAAWPGVLSSQQTLRGLSRDLALVASQVQPAVVQIRVTAWGQVAEGSGTSFLGSQRQTGSGRVVEAPASS